MIAAPALALVSVSCVIAAQCRFFQFRQVKKPVIPGRRRSRRTRNPDARPWFWIPGLACCAGNPGMTVERLAAPAFWSCRLRPILHDGERNCWNGGQCAALVAKRRFLPDLSPFLSGLQWRRRRRYQGHHRAAALCKRARRRRDLAVADLSFADG